MAAKLNLLVVEARFYDPIADLLLDGATAALTEAGVDFDVVTVPGALEIPAAIGFALGAADESGTEYDGFVALGCVIRGETYHFELVSNESGRALTDLTVHESIALGNGILTVENEEQARDRADPKRKDKGGAAARTALAMIALRERMGA
ncbi:putative Riboflavin synthase [Aurantimonas manganoxydans SI85-9A1]|uniref:6,7-dimethyl-8-ribityllumazine synthase n=2 Tax=Aurantimonas manganoxydans TaxID=651183 RepID=Q1YIM7_AURMS|nr:MULTISPECIES: 6,7-dimethyl-8-ribityllumazine synthase [Aurantimonas]EAS50090.1 putative Riboflavin synthase [Aurantimonas manganoxydans SI85-9A1]MBC6716696.1 6,7-dimethyl-8-ribityllumazine synthase [Aurantimonas sp. DM33-3]MCC4298763.1 6,7-dimethyl-8-ribityllumazine synthase [Aurantimonas coralicida]BAT29314.1 6,7-dimethyl-8-ribityllumazine synthase [Aurantimonas manganoxydans SI85-9A1]